MPWHALKTIWYLLLPDASLGTYWSHVDNCHFLPSESEYRRETEVGCGGTCLAIERQRQEDLLEFKSNLDYIVSSEIVGAA